jgi:SAM-dependent methyltransferase
VTDEHVAHFRAHAADYDRIYEDGGWRRQLAVIEASLDAAPLRGSCVDFGAGTGWWTARYVDRVEEVTLLDAAPEMLDQARTRLGARASYEVADLTRLHPSRRWDCAVAVNVLEHLPDDALPALVSAIDGVFFIAEAWRAGEGGHSDGSEPHRRAPDEYAALLAQFGFESAIVTADQVFAITATRG